MCKRQHHSVTLWGVRGLSRDSLKEVASQIPQVGFLVKRVCAGARLDGRRALQRELAELGRLGGVRRLHGPVLTKTDLNQSYCTWK